MTSAQSGEGPWLTAWYDPIAGLKAFPQTLCLSDLGGDNDFRLLVADADKRMKVYRGTSMSSVHPLLDAPVALAAFYPDLATPRVPSVAIAAGPFVYIYRNLRPYLKFSLPQIPITSQETATWEALWGGKIDAGEAVKRFSAARDAAAGLSSRAQDLAALPAGKERDDYLASVKGKPLVQQTVVTCMDTICREKDGEREMSSLVVGTEAGQLLVLDASGAAIECAVQLPTVPTHISTYGVWKGEHRINVACRDGVVYAIKDRTLMSTRLEPSALPVSLVRTDADVLVATMDAKLHSYHPKGKKNFSLTMPKPITAMARMCVRRDRVWDCAAVALEGGEVRVYNGKAHVATLQAPDTVVALRFGQYGREANTLAFVTRSGALSIKMLKRTASFEGAGDASAHPKEEDVPLPVPKKTKLYVEQTQREREQAVDMHRIFQRDLCQLRLTVARAYVASLADGGAVAGASTAAGLSLRLDATLMGLGPRFKVKLEVHNAGYAPASGILVSVLYNPVMYTVPEPLQRIPLLLPNSSTVLEVAVFSIDPVGAADALRVVLTSTTRSTAVPILTAVVPMPISQLLPPS